MRSRRRYLFTGGGTGGHVTPDIAIAEEIRTRDPRARILFLGIRAGAEHTIVPGAGFRIRYILARPFVSPRHPVRCSWNLAVTLLGAVIAFFRIAWFRPHVVVATGGYVSVPVVLAAFLLRRTIFIHEQNAHPGRANRLLARFANRIAVSFEDTLRYFPADRTKLLGYPVRRSLAAAADAARDRSRFGIDGETKVAFVLGGSMGARSINRGIVEGLRTLLKEEKIAVLHSTGLRHARDYSAFDDTRSLLERQGLHTEVPGRYVCRNYFDPIQEPYAAADLIVARAGAGTVMELAALGKPSILIPKSDSPGDHQLWNALALKDRGASEVLFEEPAREGGRTVTRVHGDVLARRIRELLGEREKLDRMGAAARSLAIEGALDRNVDEVTRLAAGELGETVTRVTLGVLRRPVPGGDLPLVFRTNLVSGGRLADVRLADPGSPDRILIRRSGGARPEFRAIPRGGRAAVNDEPLLEPRTLAAGDSVALGGERFDFDLREEEVRREHIPTSVPWRVFVTGLGTLISRITGFGREVVMAAAFGLGAVTDIFAVGLLVANFFRRVFAETAMDAAFLPTYTNLVATGRGPAAGRLFRSVLTHTFAATTAVSLLGMLTVPLWMPLLAPGFAARGLIDDAVATTRLMMPYLVLVSLAALFSATLRAFDRYGVPAFSSVLFNIGVIAGVFLVPSFGLPGLALGVLLGGAGQLLIQVPSLLAPGIRRSGAVSFAPSLALSPPGMNKVLGATPKIFADTAVSRLNDVIDKVLATPLAAGAVSALHFGMALFQLPFALIAQSINTVVLKELSEAMAVRDSTATRRLLAREISWTLFLLLPVSAALMLLALPFSRLAFEYGRVGPGETRDIALALLLYGAGLAGWGIHNLTARVFAATHQLTLGLVTNVGGLLLNATLSILLVRTPLGVGGIALATSVAFSTMAVVRLLLIERLFAAEGEGLPWAQIRASARASLFATLAAGVVGGIAWLAVRDYSGLPEVLSRILVAGAPLVFGAVSFAVAASFLGSPEMEQVLVRLRRLVPGEDKAPAAGRVADVRTLRPEALLREVLRNPGVHGQNLASRVAYLLLPDNPWRNRFIGVRLAGLLKLQNAAPDLVRILTNRERPGLFLRLLGAHFREPGFVRREAVVSLVAVGGFDAGVEEALLGALDDPYFEVRTQAAQAVGHFATLLSGPGRERAYAILTRLARSRRFDVAASAVGALGLVALDDGVLALLRSLHYHPNWKVRNAVVHCYQNVFRRDIVKDPRRLLEALDDVLITCDAFTPHFELKENISRFRRALTSGEPGP